jgi:hypothetical protein
MMVQEVQLVPRRTYGYAQLALAPVASPTDIIVIAGAAAVIGRVRRICLSGAASSAGTMPVQLVRRSSAGTLGSAVLTNIAAAKYDSTDIVGPSCTVSTFGTANYSTLGTSADVFGAQRLQMTALSTGLAAVPVEWNFAAWRDKAVTLRSASELLCVNLNGASLPGGGVVDFEIEMEEIRSDGY